ncbi:MAG: PAS domain-containing protein, partial [Bacteroidales bacterium]|nr:PAS domain-containing protein [Bacteroidales bacterium]
SDITDKYIAQKKIEESEERYLSMISNLPGFVYRCMNDKDWTMSFISDGCKGITGYAPEDFLNNTKLSYNDIIHPDFQQMCWDHIQECTAKREPFQHEFRIILPNGQSDHWVWEQGRGIFSESGQLLYLEGFTTDITQRKKAEEEIREKEVQYRNLANSGLALIWTSNTEKLCTFFNEPWLKYTGRTMEEEYGNGWTEGVHPDDYDHCLNTYVTAFDKREPFVMEYRMKHHSGEYRWILDMGTPNFNSNGEFVGFIGHCFDISERKHMEDDLIIAKERAEESDRLKSAFLANMSHEIRTPMNGILGFAEILKEPDLTGEEQQDYIEIIQNSGKRMLNIINDIIDISKIEAGLMKTEIMETNINEQINYMYTFFKPEVEAKGMKISFHTSLPSSEAIIKTDKEKLYAILTNLLKNAIKYSDEGSIDFGYILKSDNKRGELEFYVKDTGIGIPKERQEAIFERFIQADIEDKKARQGAGLGLTISKSYVEMLGGRIWVESEHSIGSTFYFTLPYNRILENVTELSAEQTLDKINRQEPAIKILIAEDDEVSGLLLKKALKMFGQSILNAQNGLEAVEICRSNPDIDLILMDIKMPIMNGYEATRVIRQFNKKVKIIAQTAYGLAGDQEIALAAGCNDYIAKPISKTDLLSIIHKYFKKNEVQR